MTPRLLTLAAPAWALAPPALACTLCHTETALLVRAEVFGPDLAGRLAAVAAPLPVLLAAMMLVAARLER